MIRAAFLKYAGQCRIGRMDGAFVTYHNTQVCVCLCVCRCALMRTCMHGA